MEIIESDVRTLGFSLQTAYFLAHASVAAYGGADDWPQILGLGDSVRSFECGEFHGFVALHRDVALAVFRGTESVGNALTDAETALIHHTSLPGLVHSGFASAADAVYPTVRVLLSTIGQDRPILVTGHSLGGAMASLVGFRLARDGFHVRAIYTFGSPRAGDRHFRDNYPVPNHRFVNDNDLVPHLPFRWCYKHVGRLKLLTRDGQLLEEEDDWKDKKRELVKHAKHVQRAHRKDEDPPLRLTNFDWLADHHMDGYIRAIQTLLPRIPQRRQFDLPEVSVRRGPVQGVPVQGAPVQGVSLHSIDQPEKAVRRPKYLNPPRPPATKPASPTLTASELAAAFYNQPAKRK